MNRRQIIAGLGSAAAWPIVARAQQSDRVRRVGLLMSLPGLPDDQAVVGIFESSLRSLGWIEGRNVELSNA